MERYVYQHILKWVRLIITRHKHAEFVVVGTRSDRLKDPPYTGTKVEADFRRRVAKWKNTFTDADDDARDDDVFSWDTHFEKLLAQKWIMVSCKTQGGVAKAREQVLDAIIDKGEHRFPLGPKHTKMLRVIQYCTKGTRRAVDMVDKRSLLKMMKTIDDLTRKECIAYLDDLHALGEVLWFPRDVAGNGNAFARTAFLDPTIAAQSLNEIVKLGQTEGRVAHDSLKQCRLWEKLDENDTLQLKCLLQHLQLAYPADKAEVTAESDMIVPACWDDRTSEELGPLTKQESLLVRECIVTNASVCWEYELSVEVSETVFTQFACECKEFGKRVTSHRTVFHDVVNSDVSAVAAITSGIKDAVDVIRVEVAGENYVTAWRRIVQYTVAMEAVLREYPGVRVSQYTVDTKGNSGIRHSLQEVTNLLDTEDRSGKGIDRKNKSWLPPQGWLAYWNDRNQLRKQDAHNETQKTLAAIHNSVISDPILRLFPAIWTLECSNDKKQVEVRMLSDYSYKCCHEEEPIVLSLPPKFLADHGSKLQVGLSFLANVLPDFVSMDLLQPHIDAVVDKAATLHNLTQCLDTSVFKSTDKNLVPGEAVMLLQSLLLLVDPGFHPLMIPKMSGLEPAVNVEGHFVWASREEIDESEGDRKLTPCFIGRPVPSPSLVTTASATSTASAESPVTYKLDIKTFTGLNDVREIFCQWELIDGSSSPSKNHGKTSEPTDDTDPLATSSVAPFELGGIQSNDQLLKYKLVVRVMKKPSSLSRSMLRCSQRLKSLVSGTVIGVGELDKLTVNDELPVPVINPKTKAQVATVTCRITSS